LLAQHFANKYSLPWYAWILGRDAMKHNKYFSLIRPGDQNLIAVSDFIKDLMMQNYGVAPAHVIPVGIDTSLFTGTIKKDIDIMGAGSLIRLKRYDLFIDVVKDISLTHYGVSAVLCGDGPEKEKLSRLINDARLSENIIMKGELPHEKVINLMQRSKIFLHTSSYEGFGSVCAEALYAGCHVISFCRPMHADIQHWHIVHSEVEMINTALKILADEGVSYERVLFEGVEGTVRKVMELYMASPYFLSTAEKGR
jgi:glycosyltransferase involved in cell wall biosynthesis